MFTIYTDFYYDGQYLSDLGYILCSFDSVDISTTNSGSQITFNTTSIDRGRKQALLSTQYDECITATFQICKDPCVYDDITLSTEDYRDIVCWLNRREYLKFYLLDNESDYYDYYFEASFNCNAIKLGDKIVGVELGMYTNRPFAIHETIVETLSFTGTILEYAPQKFNCISDEIGYIHPKITLTLNNIDISSPVKILITYDGSTNTEATTLNNCRKGEVITIDYPMITSTNQNHDLFKDFNFVFPTIGRSYRNSVNSVLIGNSADPTKEKDIEVTIEYNPIVKVGV